MYVYDRSVHNSSLIRLYRSSAFNDSGQFALPSALHRPRCRHHLRREYASLLFQSGLTSDIDPPVGLASSFLSGSKEEWSLVRRHPSETIFGVQVAGNKPANLVPTAEVLARECAGNLDFVDVNCGCPIDLVFKTGSGSAREFQLTFSPYFN